MHLADEGKVALVASCITKFHLQGTSRAKYQLWSKGQHIDWWTTSQDWMIFIDSISWIIYLTDKCFPIQDLFDMHPMFRLLFLPVISLILFLISSSTVRFWLLCFLVSNHFLASIFSNEFSPPRWPPHPLFSRNAPLPALWPTQTPATKAFHFELHSQHSDLQNWSLVSNSKMAVTTQYAWTSGQVKVQSFRERVQKSLVFWQICCGFWNYIMTFE